MGEDLRDLPDPGHGVAVVKRVAAMTLEEFRETHAWHLRNYRGSLISEEADQRFKAMWEDWDMEDAL